MSVFYLIKLSLSLLIYSYLSHYTPQYLEKQVHSHYQNERREEKAGKGGKAEEKDRGREDGDGKGITTSWSWTPNSAEDGTK